MCESIRPLTSFEIAELEALVAELLAADLAIDRAKFCPFAQANRLHALTAAEAQARQCMGEM